MTSSFGAGMFGFSQSVAQDSEGYIVLQSYSGNQRVGVTMEKFNELQNIANESLEKAEKYYNRLVELGDIVPQKSNEELMSDLVSIVRSLSQEVAELKAKQGNRDDQLPAHSKNVSRCEPSSSPEGGTGAGICGPVQSK